MTSPKVELRCPFCHAVLAPHVGECHRCHARRHTRRGLSPMGFRLFVATWLALAVPLMGFALVVGFAPWAPGGTPPGYALALVGAKASAEEVIRCRVEVLEPDGRRSVRLLEGECREGAQPAAAPAADGPSLTELRLATAVHTLLALVLGLAGSAALLPLVRMAFLRKSSPSWVRRATT